MGLEGFFSGIDSLSRIFIAAYAMVGLPCMIYMLSLHKDARLAATAIAFIAAALGVVTAPDFLWFLIFWEVTVLLACRLIVHERKPESIAVAYRYFVIQVIAGTSLFFAIAIQYAATGSFAMGAVVPEAVPFFLVAFVIKAAMIPLHIWVLLTYPCVSPAVAVILSAYCTKIGVYAFARILPGVPWIAYAGACMALFGVAMALRQKTARRLLSYHLISQVGYMIAAIGVGTELGISGGTLHMLNHVMYKSLLFMVAGAVLYRTGTEVLTRVGGVGKAMPLTFLAGLAGAAAISGVPPFNGYVSKTLLKAATDGDVFLKWALLLAGVGTAFSFAKFTWYLFLRKQSDAPAQAEIREIREMPLGPCVAMAMLALLCIGQGVFYLNGYAVTSNPTVFAVYGLDQVLWGAAPPFMGVTLFVVVRGVVWGTTPADRTGKPDASRSRRNRSRKSTSLRDEYRLWDLDVIYSWALERILVASQTAAQKARDETQVYILVITAAMLALVAFLWW